jgi:hypothetical protein
VVPEQKEEENKTQSDERTVGASQSRATSISRRNNRLLLEHASAACWLLGLIGLVSDANV